MYSDFARAAGLAVGVCESIGATATAEYVEVAPSVRLYVREWGEGPPVVFIHGWLISDERYDDELATLAQAGYRVVAITLRGYGNSDKPAGRYTFDVFADDIRAVLERRGLTGVTLGGLSLGGAIAIHYMARHHGAHVAKLALFGAAAPAWAQRPDYPHGITRRRATQIAAYVATSTALGAWLERNGVRASRRALAHSVLALRDSDLRPALATIRVPTAIFHARGDRICPFVFAEEMAKGIRGATIVPFEHSGHGLFPEEPDKFHRALVDFIG